MSFKTEKEKEKMVKTLKIEGMMCQHCQMHAKKALEAVTGVASAEVSFKDGSAKVTLNSEVADEALIKAVTDEGYKVIDIK